MVLTHIKTHIKQVLTDFRNKPFKTQQDLLVLLCGKTHQHRWFQEGLHPQDQPITGMVRDPQQDINRQQVHLFKPQEDLEQVMEFLQELVLTFSDDQRLRQTSR
jgi:hypothetical protein